MLQPSGALHCLNALVIFTPPDQGVISLSIVPYDVCVSADMATRPRPGNSPPSNSIRHTFSAPGTLLKCNPKDPTFTMIPRFSLCSQLSNLHSTRVHLVTVAFFLTTHPNTSIDNSTPTFSSLICRERICEMLQ